ncbi:MAG: metal ABC transporter ATP-binding protein [Calditrichota bacterium]
MPTLFKQLQRKLGYGHSPHEPGKPIMRVADLAVRFENGFALENISFELKHGERVAVVGPNGAGKTTLFKAMAGVIKPTTGRVEVFGNEPTGHICIGYVPQRSQVDWSYPVNVFDMVMMGRVGRMGLFRNPRLEDKMIVNAALNRVGLTDLSRRRINQLSGGQQQRIFIARALAQEAELLLMDEPLTGLDANAQRDIFEILDRLREQHVTVMVSLHDLNMASSWCERLMLLNHRLLGFGPPKDTLTSQNLIAAYGGHLHMVKTDDGMVVVEDTFCEGGDHSHA